MYRKYCIMDASSLISLSLPRQINNTVLLDFLSMMTAAAVFQLQRWDSQLKNFGFQPQVLCTVKMAPFEGPHVLVPESKILQNRVRAIRQADRMVGSSVTFVQKPKESKTSTKGTSSTKKTQARCSVFDRLGSPAGPTVQWASFSFKDLSSPISASASGPGSAVKTSSRPWTPFCQRGP